jgi:hypothetical protein
MQPSLIGQHLHEHPVSHFRVDHAGLNACDLHLETPAQSLNRSYLYGTLVDFDGTFNANFDAAMQQYGAISPSFARKRR